MNPYQPPITTPLPPRARAARANLSLGYACLVVAAALPLAAYANLFLLLHLITRFAR